MASEPPLPGRWLPRLPALLVVTDLEGALQVVSGEAVETLGVEAGALDYVGTLFGRASAIFLETHLWPLLRRDGRIDECHVLLQSRGGASWPCLVSARRIDEAHDPRVLWLFFPAQERARFEAELLAAREAAQALAKELAEANRQLEAQADAIRSRNDELDQLARTDPLTGLGNRRALDAAFRSGRQGVDGAGWGGALLMVDADHFKSVNDRWGHEAGDAVLVALAGVLRASLRREDTVVRLGGEEFALWLPGAAADVAARVAEAIHARVAALRLPGEGGRLTVSIGVAMLGDQRDPHDLATLLKRADDALYRAKAAGRNRTCRAERAPA